MKKLLALIVAAGLITVSLTIVVGATYYSETNRNIEILFGEFAGYRFSGPEAPEDIDASEIASVKFYLKVAEPIEDISGTIVELVYNSGTTGWVTRDHDLNDGLITEVEIGGGGVVSGDFFEAGLMNWNEDVTGTFSIEALDSSGNVLGNPVYGDNNVSEEESENQQQETQISHTTQPPPQITEQNQETRVATKSPIFRESNMPGEREQTATAAAAVVETPPPATPALPPPQANAARTGSRNILTATAMCMLSACAIISMRKKNKG